MNSFLKFDSFLNKVGAFFKKFIYITITTFICFVTNSAFAKIYSKLIGFVGDNSVVKAVLQWAYFLISPFIYAGIFALLLICISKMPKGNVAREAREDFEDGYPGLIKDIKNILKRERLTLGTLSGIIMLNWFLWTYCFHSVAFMLLIPFNPVCIFENGIMVLSRVYWLVGILLHILCAVFISAFYISELALMRKKWYKRNFNERIEK